MKLGACNAFVHNGSQLCGESGVGYSRRSKASFLVLRKPDTVSIPFEDQPKQWQASADVIFLCSVGAVRTRPTDQRPAARIGHQQIP
jgi:hypothetical protein